ncbi:hypothetical protein [Achromobacter sp. DH1f]|uniref:hypothetical protein n=1 Tax=Achromobacter sp. DH1f TaxID=1397275 RepID=UPI00046842CA|nr:hypothetical protein [Achromobacter sp. DH1f]
MTRRLRILWRRARRTGRDLDLAAYAAGVIGGVVFLAALTGVLGPTLDAQRQQVGAERHAAR